MKKCKREKQSLELVSVLGKLAGAWLRPPLFNLLLIAGDCGTSNLGVDSDSIHLAGVNDKQIKYLIKWLTNIQHMLAITIQKPA